MILDYIPDTGMFRVDVPTADSKLYRTLINEHGLDPYTPRDTALTRCLCTDNEYAALAYFETGTARAKQKLDALNKAVISSSLPTSNINVRIPADQELMPFQKASLAYALQRKHCLIADEPGLGKTPMAIAFANEIRARRVLVICPASIRGQWKKRIKEWSTMRFPYATHVLMSGKSGVHPNAEWTIISYDLTRSEPIARALAEGWYDLLVLDEAHYLKTIDAGRTRAVFGGGPVREWEVLAERSDRILALTGTPLPNRPREAFTLAKHMCPDAIDYLSEQGFRDRFNPSAAVERTDPSTGRTWMYIDERTGRHPELQNRLRAHIMARHLKREVLTQLPDVVHDIVQLDATQPVKLALKAESMLDFDVDAYLENGFDATGNLAIIRHQMGLALAPQAADYAETILEGGEHKLLIFGWHIDVLDVIQKKLAKYGVVRIDGRTKDKEHEKLKFIDNPNNRVLVANLMSGGVGVDGLQTVCRHVIFAEADWVFGNNQQCIDRLDRMGQPSGVLAEFLVAPGSISEKILGKSIKKGSVVHSALDKKFC